MRWRTFYLIASGSRINYFKYRCAGLRIAYLFVKMENALQMVAVFDYRSGETTKEGHGDENLMSKIDCYICCRLLYKLVKA